MLEANGIEAAIVEGGNGQFDVLRDGALVYSKQRAGGFPEEDEVLGLLGAA